jgi:hypothetical protein
LRKIRLQSGSLRRYEIKANISTTSPGTLVRPSEDLLSWVEELVLEKEGRITSLTNWIEILDSEGFGAQAARSRELLAVLLRNLAISRDNVRLMPRARALESDSLLRVRFND